MAVSLLTAISFRPELKIDKQPGGIIRAIDISEHKNLIDRKVRLNFNPSVQQIPAIAQVNILNQRKKSLRQSLFAVY